MLHLNNVPFQEQKKHCTTDFWPGFCGAVVSFCLKIPICQKCASSHLSLGPTRLWAHRCEQVYLLTCTWALGCKDDNCIGQKLRMTRALHRALRQAQDRAPWVKHCCLHHSVGTTNTPTAVPLYCIYAETIQEHRQEKNAKQRTEQ